MSPRWHGRWRDWCACREKIQHDHAKARRRLQGDDLPDDLWGRAILCLIAASTLDWTFSPYRPLYAVDRHRRRRVDRRRRMKS